MINKGGLESRVHFLHIFFHYDIPFFNITRAPLRPIRDRINLIIRPINLCIPIRETSTNEQIQKTRRQEKETHLALQRPQELLIARCLIRAILNEHAENPEPERGFAVLAHEEEMGPVGTSSHGTSLGDDCVDALVEFVVEMG